MTVVGLTGDTFDEMVAGSGVPVLVDVTAEWCPPCKAMEPVLEALAERSAGRLVVARVDSDEQPEISRRLHVRGIPTMVLFSGGAERARFVGARGLARLEAELDPFLPAAVSAP